MGVVYRATHVHTDAPVALKTVKVPDERHLHGLRREIRALSRIRHPGIVRILDQGVQGGLPWYAMELIEGVSLRQHAADLSAATGDRSEFGSFAELDTEHAATHLLDLEDEVTEEFTPLELQQRVAVTERPEVAGGALTEILDLAFRLCGPLAFLHGEGIVHRDLKPENIFVRRDGSPVLMDFGLTTRFTAIGGREQLATDARLHGTVSYMSPEQIRGDLADARTDLYALGVILYELLTGRLPYRSHSVGSILYQHLEAQPVPPTELVSGMPRRLEELVLGLLEKRPQDRIGYAEDVAVVLHELGARPASGAPSPPRPRPYLYRPRFTGRQEALETVRSWLDRTDPKRSTSTGLAVIRGPNGIGKTRFAMHVSRLAATSGWDVFTGACLPVEAVGAAMAGPLHPLRQPLEELADRCRHQGQAATERLLGPRGPILADTFPDLQTLPGQALQPRPEPLKPSDARRRLLGALTETLAAWATEQPLLLLLDDLQWADPLTTAWLAELEANPHPGILVVGTARRDDASPALQALLSRCTGIELALLGEDDVGHMVADMLALPSVPSDFVHFLTKRSRGVPFAVAEFLRAAIAERVLTRGEAGWRFADLSGESRVAPAPDALPTPASVQRMLQARLRALESTSQDLARVAATLGRQVSWDVLEQVCARWNPTLAGLTLLDAMQDLVTHHILAPEAHGQVQFLHARVREVTYASLGEDERRRLHDVVARTLETRHSGDLGPVLGALGHHWERAGETARARERYLAGARRELRGAAPDGAARLYSAALALPGADLAPVRAELAEALRLAGDLSGAMSELTQALTTVRAAGEASHEARLLAQLGQLTAQIGRLEDAVALYEQAADCWPSGEPGRPALRIARGEALVALGRLDEAAALLAGPLPSDSSLCARVLAGRGRVALERKDYGAARGDLERAHELSAGADRIDVAQDLARLLLEQGAPREAAGLLAELIERHSSTNSLQQARARANLAIATHRLGNSAAAANLLSQALHTFRQHGHHRYQGRALGHLARFHMDNGDDPAAYALAKQSLLLLDAVGDRLAAKDVLLTLARLRPDDTQHAERARRLALAQGDQVVADLATALMPGTPDRPPSP